MTKRVTREALRTATAEPPKPQYRTAVTTSGKTLHLVTGTGRFFAMCGVQVTRETDTPVQGNERRICRHCLKQARIPFPHPIEVFHHDESFGIDGLTVAEIVAAADRQRIPPEATVRTRDDYGTWTSELHWPVSTARVRRQTAEHHARELAANNAVVFDDYVADALEFYRQHRDESARAHPPGEPGQGQR